MTADHATISDSSLTDAEKKLFVFGQIDCPKKLLPLPFRHFRDSARIK